MNSNSTSHTDQRSQILTSAFLFVVAIVLYTTQPFPDFFRDEDYETGYQAASFFWSFIPDFKNMGIVDSLLYQAGMFAHSLLFYRHGAVPAIYFSLIFGVFDVLGLTFSAYILGLPTAILAAFSSVLFHNILRRAKVKSWLALAGAMAFIFSPLFAGLSRGIGTFVWIGPIFSLLLCLTALQRLDMSWSSRIFLGFAFVNLMLSDALFFLTLAALIVSFGLRHADYKNSLKRPLYFASQFKNELRPILMLATMVPVVLTLLALISSALFVVKFSAALSGTIPLNSLLLATGKHSSFGLEGLIFDGHWITYPSILLGEAAPLFICLALLSLAWRAHRSPHVFLWTFATLAGLGYGILIYVVKPPNIDVAHGYQIYTFIPLLIFLVLAADRFASIGVRAERLVKVAAGVFLISAIASCGAYLFKLPLALSSEFYAEVYGVSKPDFGTKAAGHISRRIIELNLRQNPDANISVDVYRDPNRPFPPRNYGGFMVYSTPYQENAGVLQNGDVFAHRLNMTPHITTTVMDITNETTPTPALNCPAEFCAIIRTADNDNFVIYDIFNEEKFLARIYVAAQVPTDLKPGRYQTQPLNQAFDAANTHIEDFYPPRTTKNKQHIITALKQRLGL